MKYKHIVSGSGANLHVVKTNLDIVIDAGAPGFDCDILLLTHTHGDHFKYFEEYIKRCQAWVTGIETYEDVRDRVSAELLGMVDTKYGVDGFAPEYNAHHEGELDCVIHTFPLVHDRPCTGFVIEGKKKYVHISDTGAFDFPDIAKGADILVIESNYDEYMLLESAYGRWLKQRIRATHLSNKMSADIALKALKKGGQAHFIHASGETNHHMKMRHTHKKHGINGYYPQYEKNIKEEMK